MVNGESFVFYPSFLEGLEKIKDEGKRAKALCSILEYGLYGTPIDVSDIDPDGSISEIVAGIKEDMDARKVERGRISKRMSKIGKRGGGQIGNQNARKYWE